MNQCSFCAIVEGRAPADIAYADIDVVAFAPRRPANPGHLLVVPRVHIADIWMLPEETLSMDVHIVRLARAIKEALRPNGLNIITSAGAAATQTVFHLHIHLVPRWFGDGFGHIWPSGERVMAASARESTQLIREIFTR